MSRLRASAAAALSLGAATLVLTVGAAPAAAHVTLTASTTAAGARAVLRMEVPHGCAGSATSELALRIPAGVTDVAAESTDRWAADVAGDAVTFRTDDPLPDALRDAVELTVRLPDDPGAELVFPVVQRCVAGESAWTEVADEGVAADDLDLPAPVLVVTAAADESGPALAVGAAGVLAAGCVASGLVLLLRRRRA